MCMGFSSPIYLNETHTMYNKQETKSTCKSDVRFNNEYNNWKLIIFTNSSQNKIASHEMKIWVHLCDLTFKHLPQLPSSDDQAAMWLCPKALGGLHRQLRSVEEDQQPVKVSQNTCIRWQNNACTFAQKWHCDIRLLQRSNTAYIKGGAGLPAGHVVVTILEAGRGVHVIA